MARAYSQDVRDRVIDAALAGLPARRAAVQFKVGIATAIGWVGRARQSRERAARRQGQPRRSKLDPHRAFLLGLIEATPDITLVEMQERLAQERGITASVGTIWTVLDRCGLTFKKVRPRSRAGPARHPGAARGVVREPTRVRSRTADLH
jgi:transposase